MFTIPPAAVRRGCAIAAAMAAGGLLAACRPVTAGRSAAAGASTHASLATCQSASLTVTVNTGQASAMTGSTYYPVDFTNTSKAACGMSGFPGVSFVTADGSSGRQIPAAAPPNAGHSTLAVRNP